jgi:putative Ca2+/H+ antiporter (TMEM165/GDT1 family)
VVTACSARSHFMEALFISFSTVTVAEMGDPTQLLSLMLVARYGRPWAILAGILFATLANHLAAGFLGAWFGGFPDRIVLDMVVGVSMIVMALWALKPDKLGEHGGPIARRGVFMATLIAFFIAEIGDKTQVATVALAAAYSSLAAVVTGTTAGMLAANLPVVLLGNRFAPATAISLMLGPR